MLPLPKRTLLIRWKGQLLRWMRATVHILFRCLCRIWSFCIYHVKNAFSRLVSLGNRLLAWARRFPRTRWRWAKQHPIKAVFSLLLTLGIPAWAWGSAYTHFYLTTEQHGPFQLSRIDIHRGKPGRGLHLVFEYLGRWFPVVKLPRKDAETEFFLEDLDEEGTSLINQRHLTFSIWNDRTSEIIEHFESKRDRPALLWQCEKYATAGLEQDAIKTCTELMETDRRYQTQAILPMSDLAPVSPPVRRHLISLLQDEDSEKRTAAALSLDASLDFPDSAEIVEALLNTASDADAYVRATAVRRLGKVEEPGARLLATLSACTQDEDLFVRLSCAEALLKLNRNEDLAKRVFNEVIGSQYTQFRRLGCDLRLGTLTSLLTYSSADEHALTAIETLIDDCGIESVSSLAFLLGGDLPRHPILKTYLREKLQGQSFSLLALTAAIAIHHDALSECREESVALEEDIPCNVGEDHDAVLEILANALSRYPSSDWNRYGLFQPLMDFMDLDLSTKEIVNFVSTALGSEDPTLRFQAALAARHAGKLQTSIITPLKSLLEDDNPLTRPRAALSLLVLGHEAPEIFVPILGEFYGGMTTFAIDTVLDWASRKCQYVQYVEPGKAEESPDLPDSDDAIGEFRLTTPQVTPQYRFPRKECDFDALTTAERRAHQRSFRMRLDTAVSFIYAASHYGQLDPESYFIEYSSDTQQDRDKSLALEMLRFAEPSQPIVSRLISLTNDRSSEVRRAAMFSLFQIALDTGASFINEGNLIEVASARINDVDDSVRNAALGVLGKYFETKGEAFWISALSRPDLVFRAGAVRALGEIGTEESLADALGLWRSDSPLHVRMSAFQAASRIRQRLAIEAARAKTRK